MMFTIGIVIGLLIAILVVVTLTFFRRVIEHKVTVIEKQIDAVGPKPKGFIIEPEDEASEARSEIIAENKKRGRDTPLEDLM